MNIFMCTNCDEPLHKTPFVSNIFGLYAACCTEQCKANYERRMMALARHRRSMSLGRAAWNGA